MHATLQGKPKTQASNDDSGEPTLVNEAEYRDPNNYLIRDRLYSDGSWNRVVVAHPPEAGILICHVSDYRHNGPHPEPFLRP